MATGLVHGVRENAARIAWLVVAMVFVGSMVGIERSTLPLVGRRDFGLSSNTAVLSFIAAFGFAKALTNLGAGHLGITRGRRRTMVIGWLAALPVPPLIALAPSWGWIVAANMLLGVNQGLTWSMAILMKVDLAGPARRGMVLGINESTGYIGVALAAAASGWLATEFPARDVLVVAGGVIAVGGLLVSLLAVRDTADHAALEQALHHDADAEPPRLRAAFADATFRDRRLTACSQAGLVNNLNDSLSWGLAPLFLAAHGAGVAEIGLVAGVYPAVWGAGQLWTGGLSDRVGRRPLIAGGMLTQAAALALLAASGGDFAIAFTSATLLGAGTAMAYPTLIAAVSDGVSPVARPVALGAYRFWRDIGYLAGALMAGAVADALGASAAITVVAGVTAASGLWALAAIPRAPQPHAPA